MNSNYQELRRKLPGWERVEVLLHETGKEGKGGKSLTIHFRITGHCNDLFFVQNFWVETWDAIGPTCKTFNHLQEAVEFYASLT